MIGQGTQHKMRTRQREGEIGPEQRKLKERGARKEGVLENDQTEHWGKREDTHHEEKRRFEFQQETKLSCKESTNMVHVLALQYMIVVELWHSYWLFV